VGIGGRGRLAERKRGVECQRRDMPVRASSGPWRRREREERMHAGTLGWAHKLALVAGITVLGEQSRGEGRGRVGGYVIAGGGDNSRANPSC
jgi:hypothetical protein